MGDLEVLLELFQRNFHLSDAGSSSFRCLAYLRISRAKHKSAKEGQGWGWTGMIFQIRPNKTHLSAPKQANTPLLFFPRKLRPNSTQVCLGDRRRRVAEQKHITCYSLDIHTSQLAHYIRRQSVQILSALQVASATFKNKEVLENVSNRTSESRQNLQNNTFVSILRRMDSAFNGRHLSSLHKPSHCFSLSFVIQRYDEIRDMHKYKQFRTLRHVVVSNLDALVGGIVFSSVCSAKTFHHHY